jgi:hypothetical protein
VNTPEQSAFEGVSAWMANSRGLSEVYAQRIARGPDRRRSESPYGDTRAWAA